MSSSPEKLVFDTSLEGLFLRGLGDRITTGLRDELRLIGIDLGKKLPPAVPREVWYRALSLCAKHCYPGQTRSDAMREIGVRLMKGIEETFFGKALAPVVRLLGPRRLLERVPRNMKSSNNFADGVVTLLGPHAMRIDVNDVGDAPEVFQGSLQEITTWAGAKTVSVSFEAPSLPAASFEIRWTE